MQAAERAYAVIREGILDGVHAAGARLPEEELARTVGVSRTPIREALRRLDAEGLVEFVPNRGAIVASWSRQDLEEIFQLRAMLESHGAALAAPRIDAPAVARLRDLCTRMERCGRGRNRDLDEVAALNHNFHGTILEAAGNKQLSLLLTAVVQTPLVHKTFRQYTDEALERSFAHHRELVAALEVGDPDWAASVMRSHVLAALATLSGSYEQEASA